MNLIITHCSMDFYTTANVYGGANIFILWYAAVAALDCYLEVKHE